jgi:hypothetical protein
MRKGPKDMRGGIGIIFMARRIGGSNSFFCLFNFFGVRSCRGMENLMLET